MRELLRGGVPGLALLPVLLPDSRPERTLRDRRPLHDLRGDAAIRLVLALLSCTAYHTPAPTGVASAVFAFPQGDPVEPGSPGVLSGVGDGSCYAFVDSGGAAWWAFDLAPAHGVYQCTVGSLKSPLLKLTAEDHGTSSTLFGQYRCGVKGTPIRPAELQPDGSWAIIRYEAVPCPLVFPGAELPFTWPASPNEGSVVPADSRPTGD